MINVISLVPIPCILISYLSLHILLPIHYMQINRLETEFASYKVRAHSLLQKKDSELAAARDNELLKAQEEALKVNACCCPCFT